jgi:hypothetical protein
MYKIMQKYNRKLLAIVMVFLMIAFVIPQFSRQRTPSDIAAGYVGTESITQENVRNSHYYWEILKGGDPRSGIPGVAVQDFNQETGQPTLTPLGQKLGAAAVNEIDKHSTMFVLLQKEAEQNGATVAERDLDAVLGEIQVHLPDGRNVLYDNVRNTEMGDQVRNAVRSFLLVNSSFDQALSMIKVSQPLLQNRMARELQEIKLNLVEFNNKEYADKVAPPTPEQINEQFNKYADNLAGTGDPKTNPFGFGYKYPDRVKVAYIGVSTNEIKKAIRSSKSEYDWDVDAQKYYKKNQSEFASTQPATTKPGDALSLGGSSKPSTNPTTRPFAEVRDTIVEDLIRPEATKLENQIQSRITSQMREDWNAYHAAMTKSATTAPSSALGVPYDSPEYLSKLAADVQKQFKVVPVVQTLADKFRTADELKEIPGIGSADAMFGQQFLPFNIYATALAAPFGKNALSEALPQIQKFEPSRPLTDSASDTTYIFRIIDADPAHKPADSRDVLQKIEEDLRTQQAYDLAKADAQKLTDAAKSGSLRAAAIAAKKSVISPSYIRGEGALPTDVPVSSNSRATFIEQAFDMLADATTDKTVVKVIGLPRDSKVFVAQLADVRRIPMFAGQSLEPAVVRDIMAQLGRDMYAEWYKYDALVARTHFVDASKKKESEG